MGDWWLQMLSYLGRSGTDFLSRHLDTLLATFVIYLGYRLLRVSMQKSVDQQAQFAWSQHLKMFGPGAVLIVVGLLLFMGKQAASLLFYLPTMALVVGLCFSWFGYNLLLKGVLGSSDIEAVWKDRKILFRRATPGSVFALFGLVMITVALWRGLTMMTDEHNLSYRNRESVVRVIDQRAKDALVLLDEYLKMQQSNTKTQAGTLSP